MYANHARRLTVLADFLEGFKEEVDRHFDLALWFSGGGKGTRCGTVACACGWACTIPSLQADGLRLTDAGVPYFDGVEGFDAIEEFFGQTSKDADSLFDIYAYNPEDCDGQSDEWHEPTAGEVAARIRAYLSGDCISS